MGEQPPGRDASLAATIRTWAIRVVIVVFVFEALYLIAANSLLRTGRLADLINKKPEKTNITWDSAFTYLPGVATVRNFELRSQTRKDQIYLQVDEARARISLVGLVFKTIHIRGADVVNVDFRYRQRLDRPPKPGRDEGSGAEPENTEFWPEIPGWSNPPDPRPEDLYPVKKKKRPWTIKITGADVEGTVRAALGSVLIEGEGRVGGGVTVKPRKTITIHRGMLGLDSTRVSVGGELVTDDLALDADLRFEPFAAKGAKIPEVLGGVSGVLSIFGSFSEKAAVGHVITPGVATFGAGHIEAELRLKKGIVGNGSEYALQSDAFHLWVMGLDASGSASVSGKTVKEKGRQVSRFRVEFGEYRFVDPDDGSSDISGDGFTLDAEWDGLSIAGSVPASSVTIDLPPAEIHDVGTFNALIPNSSNLSLTSGTGQVEAQLEITGRVATGTIDVVADDIALESHGTPLKGDLEVHAKLAEGDLATRRFDLSGTTVMVDQIVNATLSEKKQEKLNPWFCKVGVEKGIVTFGRPLAVDGRATIDMYDTRPIMRLLKNLDVGPGWLSLAPTITNINGSLDLSLGQGYFAFENLDMTGDGFESLGWMSFRDRKGDGRLFVRFKSVMAGVALEQGKAKIHLSKPRKWFDEQPAAPSGEASGPRPPAATED